MYCNQGDKPTVDYAFGDGTKGKFIANTAPINVTIKSAPITGTPNYDGRGFLGKFRADNCNAFECSVLMKDFELEFPTPNSAPFLYFIPCGSNSWAMNPDGSRFRFLLNRGVWSAADGWVKKDFNQRCSQVEEEICSIEITYKNSIVFKDEGKCPVNFTVICGNCPPGFAEHKIAAYPGYCCMDCDAIKNEIQSITASVRGINRG